MANEKIVQIPLANVARVELVTEENTPKTYVVDTANEMKLEAFVSEGEEKELRKLNRLLAQLKTEDLTKGYDLTMKDMVMSPPVFALVDGGVQAIWSFAPVQLRVPESIILMQENLALSLAFLNGQRNASNELEEE